MTDQATQRRIQRRHVLAAGKALFLLLTATAAWLWAHEGHAPLPTRGAQVDVAKGQLILSREAREALDVQTTEIAARPLPETVLAYATLVSPWQHHAFVTARLPGRIVQLHVQPGQSVEAEQALAEVQSVELEALQLELLNAQNDVRLSEKIVQGLEQARETVSGQSLLDAQSKLQHHRNAVEIARAKWLSLGLTQETLDSLLQAGSRVLTLPIRSPIRGTVIHADLTVGKVVEPAEHLFEVVDLSTVWAKIGVLEKDLHRVAVGQRVELRLTAYPGEVFRSTVQVKGLHLTPQTHLNTVWAELTNLAGQEPRVLPGMSGQARIFLPGDGSAKTVPADALIHDGVDRYVLVEEASTAATSQYLKKSVVLTRQSPDWAEIRSPSLVPGDRVVSRGSHELAGFFVSGVLRLSPETARTIGLRIEPAQRVVVEEVVELEAAVDVPPDRRTFASTQLAGTLQKIHIDRGQAVRAGEVLADVASLELQNLQLELLKEHLSYQLLEQQFERCRAIESVVSRRKYLELESDLNASRNRRDSLRQRLEVLGLSAEELESLLKQKILVPALPVRAPITGTVVNFDKVLGQAVRAEEPLVEIHELARPWVKGYVSERDLARVRVGQEVRVRLVSDYSVVLPGKVVRSGRVFGAENRTLSVWVELDQQPEQPLRHGQLAQLSLTAQQHEPTLAVPLAAVVREGTQAFLFLQKADGTFDRRPVETGRSDDRRVEITRGLQEGEIVAVRGTAELQTAFASVR